ncbi:hypothetical protein C0995_012482 [Termitomyces sp. Mi166|nr:hypothetical protein C0995_012482 [Termitomyces sp. Mi166\
MLDDDIEYIGTSLPFNNQTVTGLILRVDKSANDPACSLTFRRAISNVVHVGRRSSNEGRIQSDKDSAMFRCAVVYLIDLNSRHGTHVRKPSEALSTMLTPETPTKLSDGDTITFGKSVGRNNECVSPIVAHAELIYGPQESTFKPAPVKQIVHVDLTDSPPPKSNSGRYGIYSHPSSSSDNISSSVSEDSDVEEISSIPASGPNALPLQPRPPRKPELESEPQPEPSHLGRAIEALKKYLPPAPALGTPPITLPQIRPVVYTSPSREQSPNLGYNNNDYEPLYSPRSPYWPRSPCWSPLSAERNRQQSPFFDFSYCEPNPARESRQDALRLNFQDPSRSHSPMDLASPSPVTPLSSFDIDQPAQEEPNVIGAWPASGSSPRPSSPPPKESFLSVSEAPAESSPPSMQKAMSLDSICSEPIGHKNDKIESSPTPVEEANTSEDSYSVIVNDGSADLYSKEDSESKALRLSIKKLEVHVPLSYFRRLMYTTLTSLQDEVSNLQTYRRKYKARFNNNVHIISDKLSNFDERVSDVHTQYMMLVDRVDSAVDVDIPDLQAQLDDLREQIDAHAPTDSDIPFEPLHKLADAGGSVSALHSLVADIRALHERTTEQMDAELRLVREARVAALTQIAAHVEAQAQTISSSSASPRPSLKRKRSDDDTDDADCAVGDNNSERVMSNNEDSVTGAGDATMADPAAPSPVPSVAVCCHHHSHELPMPPLKRARRIATVAMQTATAVTVGAVVTWSALAFS